MKQKKNQIMEKDYERYTFKLPWSILIKGKTNKYIYSELEKKHPCFSDEWYYEKKIALKKSGINSDVVVMNRFVLAEYKNRFPGKKLWLEKIAGRSFASKNRVYEILLTVLCCLFIGVSVVISLKMKNQEKTKTPVVEQKPVIENPVRLNSVNAFLDFVEKNNGRINTIKWSSDGYSERFSADLCGIYVEQMENQIFFNNIQLGNVQYKDGKPYTSISLTDFLESKNLNDIVKQEAQVLIPKTKSVNRGQIRQIFNDYKIAMQEEKYKKLEFAFTCPSYFEIEKQNFFEAINNLAKDSNYGISRLEINRIENKNGNDGYSGVLVVEERLPYEKGINLKPFAWRTNLFIEKNKNLRMDYSTSKNLTPANPKLRKEVLIGEIQRDDGTKIRFYKNEKGKIVKEELGK